MTNLQTGRIERLEIEEYHACAAISHSKLEDFRKRPAYFYKKHITKELEQEDTKSLLIGHAAHTLILEGESAYLERYFILPEEASDKRTKRYKELAATIPDSMCELTHDEDALNLKMREAVMTNPVAHALLLDERGLAEITWRIKLTGGIYLQCRTDWFIDSLSECTANVLRENGIECEAGQPMAMDLKTVRSLDAFQGNLVNYGYHRADAFYRLIMEPIIKRPMPPIIFVGVDTSEPFECDWGVFSTQDWATGYSENTDDFKKLQDCLQDSNFKCRHGSVMKCELPAWYRNKIDRQNGSNNEY